MSLTVLADGQINSLLENLTVGELESFRAVLEEALYDYSNSTQYMDNNSMLHQPVRTSVHSNITGTTTLFMPSCSAAGHGVKGAMLPANPKVGRSDAAQ